MKSAAKGLSAPSKRSRALLCVNVADMGMQICIKITLPNALGWYDLNRAYLLHTPAAVVQLNYTWWVDLNNMNQPVSDCQSEGNILIWTPSDLGISCLSNSLINSLNNP